VVLLAAMHESDPGTNRKCQSASTMSALGGNPDGICSLRAFPLLTDGVDKIADERVEASVLERLARDFDPIFSTLRLERDYIDAADRCLAQLTFTRRTQPAGPVVVARCGLQAF
jgi:hypothetical protein